MAFSYNNSLTLPLDQVRFLIQDTDETRAIFQDEEILASMYGTGTSLSERYATAVYLIRRQLAKFAKDADYGIQSEYLKASQRHKQNIDLLASLIEEQSLVSGVVAVPISTVSNDRIFSVGMDDPS